MTTIAFWPDLYLFVQQFRFMKLIGIPHIRCLEGSLTTLHSYNS